MLDEEPSDCLIIDREADYISDLLDELTTSLIYLTSIWLTFFGLLALEIAKVSLRFIVNG